MTTRVVVTVVANHPAKVMQYNPTTGEVLASMEIAAGETKLVEQWIHSGNAFKIEEIHPKVE